MEFNIGDIVEDPSHPGEGMEVLSPPVYVGGEIKYVCRRDRGYRVKNDPAYFLSLVGNAHDQEIIINLIGLWVQKDLRVSYILVDRLRLLKATIDNEEDRGGLSFL